MADPFVPQDGPSPLRMRLGFWAGIGVCAAILATSPPAELALPGWRTHAVGSLMAVWWITEAVPLAVTSLLPLVLFPGLGVLRLDACAASYANPLIFLFMGGFMLALAMERWRLHRRLALASIGGLGTLIGTPPNALFAAYMKSAHGIQVTFLQWMFVGVPLVLVLLPLTWLLLVKVLYRLPDAELEGGDVWLGDEKAALGPLSRPEFTVALVFTAAGVLWIAAPLVAPGLTGGLLSDAGIAMSAALLLFGLPSGDREAPRVLDWETAQRLPWGVLILFGGGLALADALTKTGLAKWTGGHVQNASALPFPVVILSLAVLVVILSEVASNTATAAAFLPVAAVLAEGLGRSAVSLALPVALAASCGFMLPVATPPNTLAYGTGRLRVGEMMRAGAWLDASCIAVTVVAAMALGPVAFP